MTSHKFIYSNKDGVRRTMLSDHEKPNQFTVHTEVDVTDLVKHNIMLAEDQKRKSVNKLLARVPLTIYEKSMLEGWDESDWKKWLNDPDNKAFRVWGGQV